MECVICESDITEGLIINGKTICEECQGKIAGNSKTIVVEKEKYAECPACGAEKLIIKIKKGEEVVVKCLNCTRKKNVGILNKFVYDKNSDDGESYYGY